ncbi:LAFA_0G24388g1_1 [Lachancea sp. 'fantastica']|nr:LAFA_0G24388g1_1 [Lachancea sp. 'fantastica']
MASWFTHNLQRRLLLYFIQKISLFSQIDIAALEVSLGSSSHFAFHDLDLDVDSIDLPDVVIRSGFLKKLDLQLTVSGGLSVAASGVAFVVKPNFSKAFDAQTSSLFLTKTVYDLTSSVMHLDGSKDGFPDDDSIPDDTSESSNKGQDPGEAAAPSMLQSMRNKALDLILSKLSMTLSNISIKFLFSAENTVELTIEELVFLSANETRNINISGLALHHFKQTRKRQEESEPSNPEASMSESLLYSKAEATSIYMSAIQSMQEVAEAETPTAGQKGCVELLTINDFKFSFKGFASIDDISVRDAEVSFDRCRVNLHRVLELGEPVIIPLITILLKRPKDDMGSKNAVMPQNLRGYKRFKEEQDLHEDNHFSAFSGNEIRICISDTLSLTTRGISMRMSDHQVLQIELNAFHASHNGSVILEVVRPLGHSVIEGSYALATGDITVRINGDTNFDVEIDSARELLRCYLFLTKQSDIWLQNLTKGLKKKGKSANRATLKVDGKPLNLSFHFDGAALRLSTTDYFINLPSVLFSCNAVKLELQDPNALVDLLSICNVNIKGRSDPLQHSSFNHGFDEVILSSKCEAFVKVIKLYATTEIIEKVLSKIHSIQSELSQVSTEFGVVKSTGPKSPRHLKRSVRIMGSSSFINKQSSAVHFLVEVETIEGILNGCLDPSFGGLAATGKNCFLYYNEDRTCTGYVKSLEVYRTLDGKREVVIEPAYQQGSQTPVMTFHRKLSGKLCCAFRKVSVHYRARWLKFLSDAKGPATPSPSACATPTSTGGQPTILEIKLIECALHLSPYRLKAQMVLIIGKCAMDLRLPTMNLKGSLRAGSLLLIDDIANFKSRASFQEVSNLTPYYTERGFANIAKFDRFHFSSQKDSEGLEATVNIGTASLSLCADSLQTLVQLSVDLGIPISFPDAEKYRTKPPQVDVFNNVDENFFTQQKLQVDPSAKQVGDISTADELSKAFFDNAMEFVVLDNSSTSSDKPVSLLGAQDSYFDTKKDHHADSHIPNAMPHAKVSLHLSLERATIKLYDGFDWAYTRKSVSDLIYQVETALEHQNSSRQETIKASVFDSIYLFAGADVSPSSLRRQINKDLQTESSITVGSTKKLRLRPSTNYKIRIEATGMKINVLRYNVDEPTEATSDLSADILNDIGLSVENVEVIDNLPTSTWNKLATHWKHEPRAKGSDMISANIMTVKPIDFLAATELILKIKLLPLRLHIDQDALDFLTRFFEFKDSRFELIDEYPDFVYIQKLEVEAVKIKMDYKPKSVDYSVLKSGHKSEFMNFFILEGSELQLRHLIVYGVNGFPELNEILNGIWVPDITGRQLKGILGGVAPMKTVVTLGTGMKALVSTPIKEYKRDQNLSRGLQKGTQIFIRVTASEFVRLGVKLTSGTQALLENVEEVLGGQGSQARNHKLKNVDLEIISEDAFKKYEKLVGGQNPKASSQEPEVLFFEPGATEGDAPRILSLYADQPSSLKQGLKEAQGSFGKNVTLAYEAILKAQRDIKENANAHETASTLARVVPVAFLRPIIGATEALSKALQGMSNEIDEEQMAMLKDKYKSRK